MGVLSIISQPMMAQPIPMAYGCMAKWQLLWYVTVLLKTPAISADNVLQQENEYIDLSMTDLKTFNDRTDLQ